MLPSPAELIGAGTPRTPATNIDLHAVAQQLRPLAPTESGLASGQVVELVQAFRRLLFQPTTTELVVPRIHSLLLHLLAPIIDATSSPSWQQPTSLPTFNLLAFLLPAFEEIYPLVLEYLSHPGLSDGPIRASATDGPELQAALVAYWRLVTASPDLCDSLLHAWPTFPLETLYKSTTTISPATRALALWVYSARIHLSERERERAQKRFVGPLDNLTVSDGFSTLPLSTLIVSECARIQRIWDACSAHPAPLLPLGAGADDMNPNGAALIPKNLHPRIVSVSGVLMLKDSSTSGNAEHFVQTPSSTEVLRDLAVHASVGVPTLVSGPAACGKTALLSHLHSILHPAAAPSGLLSIALGDNTGLDAKALLGSYASSPRHPGRFEWVEGALARAMRLGYWVVLEDIDKASSEVLSVVKELAKELSPTKPVGSRPRLSQGSRGKITAATGFRLFATRTVDGSARRLRIISQGNRETGEKPETESFPLPSFAGATHWSEVRLPTPSQADVLVILQSLFPILNGPAIPTFIAAFEQLKEAEASASSSSPAAALSRPPTLRDLIKWVTRIQRAVVATGLGGDAALFNPVVQEQALLDGLDIFLGSIPSQTPLENASTDEIDSGERQRMALAGVLARALNIGSERVAWALAHRTPELGRTTTSDGVSSLSIGRASLPISPAQPGQPRVASNFAMTKSSVSLMEQLGCAIAQGESLLLVGETGTGKTTVVQQLARMLRRPLTALNLSQQSESSDLLGGFKPVEPRMPAMELHNDWNDLFTASFSAKRNLRFIEAERKALNHGKWSKLADLWEKSAQLVADAAAKLTTEVGDGGDAKRRRLDQKGTKDASPATNSESNERSLRWEQFASRVRDFRLQHTGSESQRRKFHFAFLEGPLVRALRRGEWILLDEINLAADETLEFLAGLLQSPTSSLTLTERGDLEPIPRHSQFRLFACMNPATDVGKKSLPSAIRARFTELYVPSPDGNREALRAIMEKYIGELAVRDRSVVDQAAQAYLDIKSLATKGEVADGANQRPHYSIRTLARTLTSAVQLTGTFGLRRALYEGFLMCFTMGLDPASTSKITDIVTRRIISPAKNAGQLLKSVPLAPPAESGPHVQLGPYWLPEGPLGAAEAPGYVITPSVQTKLVALARAVAIGRYPVLIQGPTSAGKTSAIEYLAKRTGHRFVRINNHEHTDLQEYLGAYGSDPTTGALRFQEGLLVRALRSGDWIVLDELNLAPTDVLEALNRLLDDNRELLIPETGEVVRPHPRFMLFATQNPPGLYGGRKVLSRAFRNRFLEAHFDDVPTNELSVILERRCAIPRSYADKIVQVFHELTRRRQSDRVFETKHSFATLRDLFRWGAREAIGYEQLAENGYMLIAERTRRLQDRLTVQEVLEEVFRVKLDPARLYDLSDEGNVLSRHLGASFAQQVYAAVLEAGLTPTSALQRLLCLQCTSFQYNEPVLFVGEPGTGKTAVCAITARAFGAVLDVVNCHQNTDASDLLGGMRPLRNRASVVRDALIAADTLLGIQSESLDQAVDGLKQAITQYKSRGELVSKVGELEEGLTIVQRAGMLFEWYDGPLILSMLRGDHILLDEISLADDSVLERLNSVLEPARTITLPNRIEGAPKTRADAEQDSSDQASDSALGGAAHVVTAARSFQLAATMNPGGDYGKKELSPALRNRFTEVWVPPIDNRDDVRAIILSSLERLSEKETLAEGMLDFADWLSIEIAIPATQLLTLRDYIAWASFIIATSLDLVHGTRLSRRASFIEGANLVVLEGLPTLLGMMSLPAERLPVIRQRALEFLQQAASQLGPITSDDVCDASLQLITEDASIGLGPYRLPRFSQTTTTNPRAGSAFAFEAPTTARNALNVLRALQVPGKSVLLEGSPGAGKTSLVAALAAAAGQELIRINLSEQTEIADLFGSEMPQPEGKPGEFAWRDAAFLTALKEGKWVLLDEMNLASQSVLEGLNSTLDHRGQIYVPELDRTFTKHDEFRVFAAQNPQSQGGGRKGLPRSFLNRFTKVHVYELTSEDFFTVCRQSVVGLPEDELGKIIDFNRAISDATASGAVGRLGRPWEFNLRDILRWIQVSRKTQHRATPEDIVRLLYISRFRSPVDREICADLFRKVFGYSMEPVRQPSIVVTPATVSFEGREVARESLTTPSIYPAWLQSQIPNVEFISVCVEHNWLTLLNGPPGTGKTATVQMAAKLMGINAEIIRLNAMSDASDLLGSFEQVDPEAAARATLIELGEILSAYIAEHTADDGTIPTTVQIRIHQLQHSLSTLASISDASQLVSRTAASVKSLLLSDNLPEALRNILHSADVDLDASLTSMAAYDQSNAGARFTWTDGPLVRCIREGRWVILQDANQCPSAVLDRLNSLFENDAVLVLAEKGAFAGQVEILRPHPNFRLFMTSDPATGELSRAMRNRGIEMTFLPFSTKATISEDTSRMRWVSRSSRPFLQSLPEASAASRPAVWAFCPPLLDSAQLRQPMITLSNGLAQGTASAAANLFDFLAEGSLFLGSLSRETTASAAQLVAYQPELVSALKANLPIDMIHARWQKTFDPIICPERASDTSSESKHRSFALQLQSRAHIIKAHLDHVASELVALPDEAPLLHTYLYYRRNQHSSVWPPGLGRMDVIGLIGHLIGSATFADVAYEPEEDSLALYADISDAVLYLLRLCSARHLNYAALHTVFSQLSQARVLRQLPQDHALAKLCTYIASSLDVLVQQRGVAMSAIWEEFATSSSTPAAHGFSNALCALRVPGHTESFERIVSFLTTLFNHTGGICPEDAELLAQITHAVGPEHIQPNIKTERFPVLLCAAAAASPFSSQTSRPDIYDGNALLRSHGHELFQATSPALGRLLLRRIVGAQNLETSGQAAVMHLDLWDLSWAREMWTDKTVLADYFKPFLVRSAQSLLDTRTIKLSTFALGREQRRRQSLALILSGMSASTRSDVFQQHLLTVMFLLTTVLRDASVRGGSYEESKMLSELLDNFPPSIHAFASLLSRARVELLGTVLASPVWTQRVVAWTHACSDFLAKIQQTCHLADLGDGVVHIALQFLQLFVSEVPVDPLAARHSLSEFQQLRQERGASTSKVALAFEARTLQRTTLPFAAAWPTESAFAGGAQSKLDGEGRLPSRGSNLELLGSLTYEVNNFVQDVVDPPRVLALLSSLRRKADDEHASSREALLQQSLGSFLQQLEKKYASIGDLVAPLTFSLDLLSFGLQSVTAGVALEPEQGRSRSNRMFSALLSPSSSISAQLTTETERMRKVRKPYDTQFLLVHLAAKKVLTTVGEIPKEVAAQSTRDTLESLAEVHRQQVEEKARAKEEESSIFRSKTETVIFKDDAELEEEEFLKLFPDYQEYEKEPEQDARTKNTKLLLNDDNVQLAASILLTSEPLQAYKLYDSARRGFVSRWLPDTYSHLDDKIDNLGAHQTLIALCRPPSGERSIPDFYHDVDPTEVDLAIDITTKLSARLKQLAIEWPEQEAIRQLADRCEKILSMHSASPVPRLMSAFEQLLEQSEDWEGYAHSGNSLRLHREAITAAIIRWRRMQLHSWQHLLDLQEVSHANRSKTHLFPLFSAAVSASWRVAIGGDPTVVASHSLELLGLLDQFMRSSPLGEYEGRLSLLTALADLCESLSHKSDSNDGGHWARRTANLLRTSSAFFRVFFEDVKAHVRSERAKMEKEINEFTQIASWKDTNIYALRQSAHKTHRKLHKVVSSFRKLLNSTADAVLAAGRTAVTAPTDRITHAALVVSQATDLSNGQAKALKTYSHVSHSPVLGDLTHSLKLVRRMHQDVLSKVLASTTAEFGTELAKDIQTTADDLRTRTPALMTKKNEKLVKALLTEKTRAFTSVLKQLRVWGISSLYRDDEGNKSRLMANMDTGTSPAFAHTLAPQTAADADGYYLRMLALLPMLRASLPKRSPDIPPELLVRAHGTLENLVDYIAQDRASSRPLIDQAETMGKLLARLSSARADAGTSIFVLSSKTQAELDVLLGDSIVLADSAAQLCAEAPTLADAAGLPSHVRPALLSTTDELACGCKHARDSLRTVTDAARALSIMIVDGGTIKALQEALDIYTQSHMQWCTVLDAWPLLRSFASSVVDWAGSSSRISRLTAQLTVPPVAMPETTAGVDAITAVVLVVQNLKRLEDSALASVNDEEKRYQRQRQDAKRVRAIFLSLPWEVVWQSILAVPPEAGLPRHVQVPDVWLAALPFFQEYQALLIEHLKGVIEADRGYLQLAHTAGVTLLALTTKGFCTPQEQDESAEGEDDEDDAEEGGDVEEGTGLGDGTGAKDISDQVKDEEQIEELQKQEDDPQQQQEGETQAEKNAKEMDNDFDGDLGNLEFGDEGEDQDDNQDEDGDMDDAMDNVDHNLDEEIDEQMWSGENEPEPETTEEKGQTGQEADNLDHANENAQEEAQAGQDAPEKGEDNEPEAPEDQGEEPQDQGADENEEKADDKGEQKQPEQSEKAPEIDPLAGDLDMNEGEDDEPGSDEEDQGQGEAASEEKMPEQEGAEEQSHAIEPDQPEPEAGEEDGEDKDNPEDGSNADAQGQPPNEEEGDGDEAMAEGEEPEADTNEGENQGDDAVPKDMGEGKDEGNDADDSGGQGTEAASKAVDASEDPMTQDAAAEEDGEQDQPEDNAGANDDAAAAPAPATMEQNGQSGAQQRVADAGSMEQAAEEGDARPEQRSLGDALREFRRDVERIFDNRADGQDEAMPEAEGEDPMAVEHVGEDQDTNMQSVGATEQTESSNLKGVPMDAEQEDGSHRFDDTQPEGQPQELTTSDLRGMAEQEESSNPKHEGSTTEEARPGQEAHESQTNGDAQRQEPANVDATEMPEEDEDLEARYAEFRTEEPGNLEDAADLWQMYVSRTSELAFRLSEQLRLILTPTLATRMRGDYRTGKRLNMRQIIPFIASDFAKDKIWLRRTRPSARQYQILLAVDDSKSMAHSRSAHLAVQTIALLQGALTKLEAGDMAVCRFGSQMDILHGFGQQVFSAAEGARMLSQLTFAQRSTDVLKLLQSTVSYLSDARASQPPSAAELWQLAIIVSDGMTEDHDRIRALLRKASENRIVVVFVVLDSLNNGSMDAEVQNRKQSSQQAASILSMKKVDFATDASGGFDLKMVPYLDTFPFDNYIIVQDISTLPDVLSATLRQWAERVNAE